MTSLLFTIGKFLIGVYLGKSDVGLAYGAAGSLIVILLWVYYASQIFLFGAEFTAVYAASHGSRLIPTEHAMPAHEGAGAVPGVASLSPRRSREAKEPRIGVARISPHIEVARMTVRDVLIIGGGLAAVLYLGRRPRDY